MTYVKQIIESTTLRYCAAILYERLTTAPPDAGATAPFVVNITFSLELYLKTLASRHGKALRSHELAQLFKKLPSAAKQAIEQELPLFAKTSEWADGLTTMDDLRRVVNDLDTAFLDWRYLHEKPEKLLRINFKPTIFLSEVLHAACQKHAAPKE